jgi:hypothetical protein
MGILLGCSWALPFALGDFTQVATVNEGRAAWGDYNQDGWVDLLGGNRLMINQGGTGTFDFIYSFGGSGIFGDYDKDGDLDIFDHSARQVERNDGIGFTSVSVKPLPSELTRGAAWGDFNGDTYLDLYVGGYERVGEAYYPDVILTNDGNGAFNITWQQSGDIDPARGITTADYDEDGDLDIYVSNYRLEQNQLWQNDGSGNFTNVAPSVGVEGVYDGWSFSYGHTIGSAFGDLNNDGHLDLFVGNFAHGDAWQDRAKIYQNLGPDTQWDFQEVNQFDGGHYQESYASPTLGDIDNDGDLDLYYTTVYAGDNPRLYRNDGNFHFSDVTSDWGLDGLGVTYQAAFADFDNDGYLDLVTAGRVFKNSGGNNHYFKVHLDGLGIYGATPIGSQVRINVNGETLVRQIEGAVGEGNQNDFTLHFGLGSYSGMVDAEIIWPDGTVQNVTASADQTIVVTPSNEYEWVRDGSGSWLNGGNWSTNAVPNNSGVHTYFGSAASTTAFVSVAGHMTVNTMRFDNDQQYRISSGSITLESDEEIKKALIEVVSGDHRIYSTLNLASNAEARIDSGAEFAVLGQLHLGDYTLTKTGGGTLKFNGNHGVHGGKLIGNGGTIKGDGTLGGSLHNFRSVVAPGDGLGVLNIAGTFLQTPGGTLQLEIGGTQAGVDYDQLVANVVLLGGTLEILLVDGYVPVGGESFDLFDFDSMGGLFAAMELPSGIDWDTSNLYVDGTLSVALVNANVPEPTNVLLFVIGICILHHRQVSKHG